MGMADPDSCSDPLRAFRAGHRIAAAIGVLPSRSHSNLPGDGSHPLWLSGNIVFKRRILFVVGAGASCEVSLPSGDGLKHEIARKLLFEFDDFQRRTAGDVDSWGGISLAGKDKEIALPLMAGAASSIHSAMFQAASIDNYLDHHRGNPAIVECGKIGIVKAIADAEAGSRLRARSERRSAPDFAPLEGTWFGAFFKLLLDGANSPALLETIFDNVAFITFNYDRCIEHYLIEALKNYYGMGDREAATLMQRLKIIHIYGAIAPLPWQVPRQAHPFGERLYGPALVEAARRIRIFTEQIQDEEFIGDIRVELQRAHRIVFLGYSFQQQNMQLLAVHDQTEVREVFGTTFGLSGSRSAAIRVELLNAFRSKGTKPTVTLMNSTCTELFREHGHEFIYS